MQFLGYFLLPDVNEHSENWLMAGHACYNSEILFKEVDCHLLVLYGHHTSFSVGDGNVWCVLSVPYIDLHTHIRFLLK